jgi:serine/threonine-protein kinase RsbW
MLCHQLEACSQQILPTGTSACRESVHSAADMVRLIETIITAMAGTGHAEKDLLRVRLALEEALVNASKHGHQGDWSRPITVHYHVGVNGVLAEIEDQGPGFDPTQIPDPLAPENLERPSGRGLLLMRTYMTGICHNEQGNRVCLCKHRLATD